MTDWKATASHFAVWGLPVFPIAIAWDDADSKWTKRPLTKSGHLDASVSVDDHDWSRANGVGLVMGNGWYGLDVDDYKDASEVRDWIKARDIPMKTRIHTTVSGGAHMIYRTNGEFLDLRSRQGVVRGLDTRGAGGWLAFGEGYGVKDASEPAYLPIRVCRELSRATTPRGRKLAAPEPYDPSRIDKAELRERLMHSKRILPKLEARWRGDTSGLGDTSRSAMDLSLAQLLSLCRFTFDEIVFILLHGFEHGQARYMPKGGERAARRCAQLAAAAADERRRLMTEAFSNQGSELTEDQADAMRRLLNGQNDTE